MESDEEYLVEVSEISDNYTCSANIPYGRSRENKEEPYLKT